ncbi:hypothetical protein CYLTODRAFT_451749 [Cylindrobasidium torrendii FP15055 ss-10]|uniref:DUF6532 domain-containing protein n=1 Tax=Cylindrobasidium torrendii FP15055 ss-10 TaxID=1314674 RepID=A0A0D7BJM4_9AGAR|nr:hypothetical protein CYLTODRAFT_451749 [Cylindrobasidium torrendii FP15055 ss-10]
MAGSKKARSKKATAPPQDNPPPAKGKGKGKAAQKPLTAAERREARKIEICRRAEEDLEAEEDEEDAPEDEERNKSGEEDEPPSDGEWTKDNDFPFPPGHEAHKDSGPEDDDGPEIGAADVIDISATPPRPRKKRTNVELSPTVRANSKTRKTVGRSTPSGASSDAETPRPSIRADANIRKTGVGRTRSGASSEAEMPLSDGPDVYVRSGRSSPVTASSDREQASSDGGGRSTRRPRPMHGLNGKVTLAFFSKPHESDVLHALKEFARFHYLMIAAFPRNPINKKAPYWAPIFQEYFDKEETPPHYKKIWADWLQKPVVLEAACEHVVYTRADLFRIIMKAVKNHLGLTGVPGAQGQYTSEEIAELVAWHNKHKIWHHGVFDVLDRSFDSDTAYEVLWVIDVLREFMYDNRGGLDGLCFLHLKMHQKMPMPMLALLLTVMWHFISQWETGSHNPNKPFGDSYQTLYWFLLDGIVDMGGVEGWWDQHSHDIYSNKPYMLDDTPTTNVNAGVNKDAVRARVLAKAREKEEAAKKLAEKAKKEAEKAKERARKAAVSLAVNQAAAGPSSVSIRFPPPVE